MKNGANEPNTLLTKSIHRKIFSFYAYICIIYIFSSKQFLNPITYFGSDQPSHMGGRRGL